VGYPKRGLVLDETFFKILTDAGVAPERVALLKPLRGRKLTPPEVQTELGRLWGPEAKGEYRKAMTMSKVQPHVFTEGAPDELSARGSFDQLLAVFPSRDLVVVRFTQQWDESSDASSFPDFDALAKALVPLPSGT
jgi:CubicO group peptidase (beta-lactamase class C family)